MSKKNVAAKETHVIERVNKVQDMLVGGWFRRDIVSKGKEDWGVSANCIDKYIRQAKDKIEKRAEKRQVFNFSKAQSRLEDLYKKNMETGDYQEALRVNREFIKLCGLENGLPETQSDDEIIISKQPEIPEQPTDED